MSKQLPMNNPYGVKLETKLKDAIISPVTNHQPFYMSKETLVKLSGK